MLYFSPYDWLILPPLILSLYAAWKVRSTFAKYSRVRALSGMTGRDAARMILRSDGITDVTIEVTPGQLTDHYHPTQKALRLSEDVYYGDSIAALGVAAHEAGHAVQHHRAFAPLVLRNMAAPVTGIGSYLGPVLFMIGLFMGAGTTVFGYYAMLAGIVLFGAATAFAVITVPVEIDASRRAMKLLVEGGHLTRDEAPMARKVLTAAALTYLAGMLMAMMQLLKYVLIFTRMSRDD